MKKLHLQFCIQFFGVNTFLYLIFVFCNILRQSLYFYYAKLPLFSFVFENTNVKPKDSPNAAIVASQNPN